MPPRSEAARWARSLALLLVTTISVLYVGEPETGGVARPLSVALSPKQLLTGWVFALPLLTILVAHELGHFFAAKLHRVAVSPPYFLPMPFSPFGTWGAIISMPERIRSRRALLDIGAAGPLAGMLFALPVLVLGLRLSTVQPLEPHALLEGQCLLYSLLKRLLLDIPPGHDVFLHPVAFAGWAGLFVTMINLLPIAQLDGGHVAYALLGKRQNRVSRLVHLALVPLFLVTLSRNLLRARAVGSGAMGLAVQNSTFWLFWFGMLFLLMRVGGKDHPPTDGDEPLGPVRTVIAVLCLVLFVLLFMPAPFTMT